MSNRQQQVADRLWDFVQAELKGEEVARSTAGPEGLREADGTPTPPGADLMTAMGVTYALLALDYWQGNVHTALESFGAAIQSALKDPRVRARTQFQRTPARRVD